MSKIIRKLTSEKRSAKIRAQAWPEAQEYFLSTIHDLAILPALDANPPKPEYITLWYAKRVETAVKAEILYALISWKYGAASRNCVICGRAFLRAKSYNGRFCCLCRALNTYQQGCLIKLDEKVRQILAPQVYMTHQTGQAFTDWPKTLTGVRA